MRDGAELDDKVRWFRDVVKHIRVAMLATTADDGTLHARPLATRELDPRGTLRFELRARAPQVSEVEKNPHVVLTYAAQRFPFVSVSGVASVERFPDDDARACLSVRVESVEYWDAPGDAVAKVVEFLSAPESALRVAVQP